MDYPKCEITSPQNCVFKKCTTIQSGLLLHVQDERSEQEKSVGLKNRPFSSRQCVNIILPLYILLRFCWMAAAVQSNEMMECVSFSSNDFPHFQKHKKRALMHYCNWSTLQDIPDTYTFCLIWFSSIFADDQSLKVNDPRYSPFWLTYLLITTWELRRKRLKTSSWAQKLYISYFYANVRSKK